MGQQANEASIKKLDIADSHGGFCSSCLGNASPYFNGRSTHKNRHSQPDPYPIRRLAGIEAIQSANSESATNRRTCRTLFTNTISNLYQFKWLADHAFRCLWQRSMARYQQCI